MKIALLGFRRFPSCFLESLHLLYLQTVSFNIVYTSVADVQATNTAREISSSRCNPCPDDDRYLTAGTLQVKLSHCWDTAGKANSLLRHCR